MKDNNLYRKLDNGRYDPCGVWCNRDRMCDGLWYVRHTDNRRSTSNLSFLQGIYKLGDAEIIDLPKIAGLENICDEILDSEECKDFLNNKNGYTFADAVRFILSYLYFKKNGNAERIERNDNG